MPAAAKKQVPRWGWVAAATVLTVAAIVLYRARSANAAPVLDTSGTPRPPGDSLAQQPNGGAASVTGNLPPFLVAQPDPVQQQVQMTDASSIESPQALTAATVTSTSTTSTPPPVYMVGSTYYEPSSPGSDYVVGLPPSHPGTNGASQIPSAVGTGDVRRPGFQPDT